MGKNLIETFKKYLENKKNGGYNANYYSPAQNGCGVNTRGDIYFYEWSDINCTPRHFNTLADFEKWLNNECQIYLMQWQRESLLAYGANKYVICRPGCKDLLIRHTFEGLKTAFAYSQTYS